MLPSDTVPPAPTRITGRPRLGLGLGLRVAGPGGYGIALSLPVTRRLHHDSDQVMSRTFFFSCQSSSVLNLGAPTRSLLAPERTRTLLQIAADADAFLKKK